MPYNLCFLPVFLQVQTMRDVKRWFGFFDKAFFVSNTFFICHVEYLLNMYLYSCSISLQMFPQIFAKILMLLAQH